MTSDPQPVTYFSRLDAQECWSLLADAEVGRVAWQGTDGVAVVPVNFKVEGESVVFHTAEGSSLSRLVEPTEVAFQCDDIDRESAIGWSVLVRGTSGAAQLSQERISWLEGDRPVWVAITAGSIEGRVVSGTKRNEEDHD